MHDLGRRSSTALEPTLRALRCYDAAVADHEAQDSIATCEALLEARLAVLRTLVAEGWRPPDRVADALTLDDLVAHLGLGGAAAFEGSVQERKGTVDR